MLSKACGPSICEHPDATNPIGFEINSGHRLKQVDPEGNVFRARKVEVGPGADGQVRILTGLIAGEKIVTDGAIFTKKEVDRR